ncbi:MAG: SDR family oxidoreductase [Clostridiales bacterium]|nr:SDR family oxidoreductase [Clostridiales bacterium]
MSAIITGASSGIGRHMAKKLSDMGFDTVITGRNEEKLTELAGELKTKTKIITADLSKTEECIRLYEEVKDEKPEILINNAGFGEFAPFAEGSLETELNMIDTNIKAVHVLMKLFLKDFIKKDFGYILNTCSLAAFLPGPMMATYYGTKSYVYRLTMAVREELRRKGSNVYCGVLCPGPVKTGFNSRAGVKFATKGIDPKYCADYAIEKMFAEKAVIIPGKKEKLLPFLTHISPAALQAVFCYEFQKKKDGK